MILKPNFSLGSIVTKFYKKKTTHKCRLPMKKYYYLFLKNYYITI